MSAADARGDSTPRIKPEVVFAHELIRDVLQGRIRIPLFQRRYVWSRKRMIELLDSVRLRFPIGSLFLWATSTQRLASQKRVGHIHVLDPPGTERVYVVDGQHRLSTLVGVLTPRDGETDDDDPDPERWDVRYDARDDVFAHIKRGVRLEPWQFPMDRLLDTIPYLGECRRMLESGDSSAHGYVENVERLAAAFHEYKLPVISIEETDLRQAVDAFVRLNSHGQRMTADQMLSAVTYDETDAQPTQHLAQDIDEILRDLAETGFGRLDRELVVRAVLVAMGQDPYRTDWTGLAAETRDKQTELLREAVDKARAALLVAVRFLNDEGVRSDRLLPYGMQIVVLSAFFCVQPDPAPWQKDLLRRWFWVTTFTAWFALANSARVRDLINECRRVAEADKPTVLHAMPDEPARAFPKRFDMRSARSRALLLVLLEQEPRDESGPFEKPWELIDRYGADAIGRIVPKPLDKKLVSSPANRLVRPPSEKFAYAKAWIEGVDEQILKSHCIPTSAREALRQGDHDSFLKQRLDALIDLEREFMVKRDVTPPTDREPQLAPIDNDDDSD